jgi:serine/threonine-protein phosphatase 2A regulatory subunit B
VFLPLANILSRFYIFLFCGSYSHSKQKKTCEYKFHTEFQSHEPEFDYLKSLEIEEKINKIKWCRRQNASHYLLSTNDKTIKLWKVFEKSLKVVAENNLSHDLTPANIVGGGGAPRPMPNIHFRSASDLKLPRLTHHDTVVAAVPRRTYANAHAYHINSISVNSDGETFISSDDLRINLWNLNIQDQSFNIVDIKPANMEELTEVITAAEFHPLSCNWFMYASSKGTIKLADMRESALCDQHAKRRCLQKSAIKPRVYDLVANSSQCLSRKRTPRRDLSFPRLSHPSQMSDFRTTADTSFRATT